VGYTIIPAIAVGLINVQEEKNNTFIGTLTTRYGFTNRWEGELRVPYVYRNNDTVSLPFDTGSATATPGVYGATGKGLGDIEFATRYQFNDGGAEKPYYIGSLRFKTRTGTDPFQVENLTSLGNQYNGVALQSQLPTGSGFYSLQPGLTVLYPSDPVVFFGGLSYLHNFKRTNVYENTDQGNTYLGTVSAGDVATFNFGMGLALNSRSSFSIGYEQDSVGKTLINGSPVTGTTRIELGTLLLGYSYRLSDSRTLNIALGVGVTRDTPDVTLTFRLPMSF
jgi:hypothetical protein